MPENVSAGEPPQSQSAQSHSDQSHSDGAARIEPLATLPVFYKVAGQRVVLAGGSEPAVWKAELLMAAGAHVHAFAETFAEPFSGLAARTGPGSLKLHTRPWVGGDLDGAVLAIGAITNDREAQAFVSAARDAGVPVNIVDRPEFCAFQFGAVVNRSPLIVAISTGGAAPVFGQTIRSWIEQLLPPGFKRWADAAQSWRKEGERLGKTMAERRRFWERFSAYAVTNANREPSVLDRETLIAENAESAAAGTITFVEVASRDPESLTLRAVRSLRTADLIIFDADISAEVLSFARREAERRPSRMAADGMVADGDVALMAEEAKHGKRVVRVVDINRTDYAAVAGHFKTLEELAPDVERVRSVCARFKNGGCCNVSGTPSA